MKPFEKRFWLILVILPFLVPIPLLVVRLVAASLSSTPAGKMVFVFVGNFWWLMIILAAVLNWVAYLLHAQHSMAVPDASRQGWTMLLFFFGPIAAPFYYLKFIAPVETNNA